MELRYGALLDSSPPVKAARIVERWRNRIPSLQYIFCITRVVVISSLSNLMKKAERNEELAGCR